MFTNVTNVMFTNVMFTSIVDYIPLSFLDFLKHFVFILISIENKIHYPSLGCVYGSSCRSLFHTLCDVFKQNSKKKKHNILVTPLHHTSFRNIIELFFRKDEITVLPMNESYNKIIVDDHILSLDKEYDMCIVTHMFGQDLDVSELKKLSLVTKNCLFVEDRVQGGVFSETYSSKLFDVSLYSSGMDKKPCALGGGIVYSKNKDIVQQRSKKVETYRHETALDRFIFILKKIPTYILYNCKTIIYIVIWIFKMLTLDLYGFICYYRKKNPGFMHDRYNIRPCAATVGFINYALKNINCIETTQKTQYRKCSQLLDNYKLRDKYIPWYDPFYNNDQLTIYNTIYARDRQQFIDFCNKKYVPVIDNPTYKLFNFDYNGKQKDRIFNDSLVYIPSLYAMPDNKIDLLVSLIQEYDRTLVKIV